MNAVIPLVRLGNRAVMEKLDRHVEQMCEQCRTVAKNSRWSNDGNPIELWLDLAVEVVSALETPGKRDGSVRNMIIPAGRYLVGMTTQLISVRTLSLFELYSTQGTVKLNDNWESYIVMDFRPGRRTTIDWRHMRFYDLEQFYSTRYKRSWKMRDEKVDEPLVRIESSPNPTRLRS
jgi:hypothetical protein